MPEGVKHTRLFQTQRKMLFVAPPADIHKVESVGGDACGVDGTKFILADSCGAASEHVHAVLLRYRLRQHRDGLGRHVDIRGSLHLLLPARHLAVGKIVNKREIGHGQDLADLFTIIPENLHEVFLYPGLLSDLVQKPCRPILAVNIILVILDTAAFLLPAAFGLAQVKPLGKYQLLSFRRTGVEVRGIGMEYVVFID